MKKSNSIVVYCYIDPQYSGDLYPLMEELRQKGIRTVIGDNADELKLLLQMGRPSAIFYTMASERAKDEANYKLIAGRALELLVPMILVGPDDPREGVVLLYPHGSSTSLSHVPFHSISELVEEFFASPPSTPSRPPERMSQQTLGQGRNMLKWSNKDGSAVSYPPEPKTHRDSKLNDTVPGKRIPHAVASHLKEIKGDEGVEDKNDVDGPVIRTVESFRSSTEDNTDRYNVAGELRPELGGEKNAPIWSSRLVLGIGIILGIVAVGVVAYVAVQQKAFHKNGNGEFTSDTETLTTSPSSTVEKKMSVGIPGKQREIDGRSWEPNPIDAPLLRDEQPIKVPVMDISTDIPTQRKKTRPHLENKKNPSSSLGETTRLRFPARFRHGKTVFWFADGWDEHLFLKELEERSANKKIRIVGHPTYSEISQGFLNLGKSRAWAVHKYLIRKGLDGHQIVVDKGEPVSDVDMKEAAWPSHQLVYIEFE